jgi:uncharacterized protein (TIRG00374 family)
LIQQQIQILKINSLKNKKIKLVLQILISALAIAFLWKTIDFQKLQVSISLVPWYIYGFSLLISIFRTWVSAVRWKLINPDSTNQMANWQYFRFSMISHIYNMIMPGALGGDVAKGGYVLNHIKHKKGENVISILVDRFIGLFSIFIMGVISLSFIHIEDSRHISVAILGVVIVCVFGIIFLMNKNFILFLKNIRISGKIGVFYVKIDRCMG